MKTFFSVYNIMLISKKTNVFLYIFFYLIKLIGWTQAKVGSDLLTFTNISFIFSNIFASNQDKNEKFELKSMIMKETLIYIIIKLSELIE